MDIRNEIKFIAQAGTRQYVAEDTLPVYNIAKYDAACKPQSFPHERVSGGHSVEKCCQNAKIFM